MMKILWILLLGLTLVPATFSRNLDIVTDNELKLQWQDNENQSSLTVSDWDTAINHCKNLTLDGIGWRLPNIRELKSIVDRSRVNPAIDNTFNFTEKVVDYWSSSTEEERFNRAWNTNFFEGISATSPKADSQNVRCVRDLN